VTATVSEITNNSQKKHASVCQLKSSIVNSKNESLLVKRNVSCIVAVTFEYRDRGEPVLMDASVEFRRGRSTALIGASGASKSTVINLICRLLEPVSGMIKVDGQPLSRIDISTG
jgi:ABC-type multidrug transport system fused ATPase/permease subunit